MISLEDVSLSYKSDFVETRALDRVSLHIGRGDYLAIRGPSGCGKSSLMSVLGLIEVPTQGVLSLMGQPVGRLGERQRAAMRLRHIAFIFQDFNLLDELTVWENVALPLRYAGLADGTARQRAMATLAELNLDFRAHHFPHQLSGGQRQRVALARAIVKTPDLLLADEPTGNLDSANGTMVMDLFADLNRRGVTIVMVTHSEEYSHRASRVVTMLDGRIRPPEGPAS